MAAAASTDAPSVAADPASSVLVSYTLGLKRRALNSLDLEGAGFVVRQPNEAANSASTESLEHDDVTVAMLCANLEKALVERIAPGIISAIAALLPCVADQASVILDSGIVARLATFCLSRAQAASSVQLLDSAAKLFTLLCKASPTPEFGPLSRALPALADMLYSSSHEQLCNAVLAVATLADQRDTPTTAAADAASKGAESSAASDAASSVPLLTAANNQIQVVVQAGVVRRLVELLSHKSSTVKAFALRAVGSICSGDDLQTQVVLASGALPALLTLLAHPMKLIRLDAVWALSNILAGSGAQIQVVLDSQHILPTLLQMLEQETVEMRREIVLALGAALAGASAKQTHEILQAAPGLVRLLCELLDSSASPDVSLQLLSLQCLELLLARGPAASRGGSDKHPNPIAEAIEECEGLDHLESLQTSACAPVVAKAVALLTKFFDAEEAEELEAAAPAGGSFSFAPAKLAASAPVAAPFCFSSQAPASAPFNFGSQVPAPFSFGCSSQAPPFGAHSSGGFGFQAQVGARAEAENDDAVEQSSWRVEWLEFTQPAQPAHQLAAAIGIRKALCEDPPPVGQFIDQLPIIVQRMQSADTSPRLLEELVWIVCNMASSSAGPFSTTRSVIAAGAVPVLVSLLCSPTVFGSPTAVAETAAFALGNIVRDSPAARQLVLSVGAMQALGLAILRCPGGVASLPMRINCGWALRGLLCGGEPLAANAVAAQALPALERLLDCTGDGEEEVLVNACETIATLTEAAPSRLLSSILDSSIVSKLCGLLHAQPTSFVFDGVPSNQPCSVPVRRATLQALGNLAAICNARQVQHLIDAGILHALFAAFSDADADSASAPLRVLGLWTLSNVLRGAPVAQIAQVHDAGLLPKLMSLPHNPRYSKTEAHNLGYVFANLLRDCSESQLKSALDAGVLREILAMLPHASPKLLRALLQSLEVCLTYLRDAWMEGDAEFGASAFIEENTDSHAALLALCARSHSEPTMELLASLLEEFFNVTLPKKKKAAPIAPPPPSKLATPAADAPSNNAAAALTSKPVFNSKPLAMPTATPATVPTPAVTAVAAAVPVASAPAAASTTKDGAVVTRHACNLCSKVFAAAHFLDKHKISKHAVAAPGSSAAPAPAAAVVAATADAAKNKTEAAPAVVASLALPQISALSLAPQPQPQPAAAVSQLKMLEDAAAAAVLADRINAALASIDRLRASSDEHEQNALSASLCDAMQRASSAHLDALMERGVIEALAHVLAAGSEVGQEHAVAALGHLAASSPQRRDAVLAAGVLPALLHLCVPIAGISLLRRCVGTLASLCRRDVDWSVISAAVPVLAQLLKMRGDEELMLHLCSAFGAISEPADPAKDGLIQPAEAARLSSIASSGAARSLVDLLLHRSLQLQSSAFVVVAQLALGDESVLQVVLTETGLLASLRTTLAHSSPAIRAAAARVLKHLTRSCSGAHMQLLISAALVPLLVARRRTDEIEVRSEAAGALCSMATRGDPSQIRYLVTQGVMQQLCCLLDPAASDVPLLLSALSGLESMLRVGALTSFEEALLSNRFSKQLEQGEGRQSMRALLEHRDPKVAEAARAILATHFPTDNPAAAASAASSSASASASAAAAAAPAPAPKSRADEIAALRPLLLSDSAASQLRALQGLRALLVSSPSSVLSPLVESSGLLARVVFLLLSNSDVQGVPNAAAQLLVSVASVGSDSQKQLLLELSALPCIFMMLHKSSGEAQRSALSALRALLGGSAAIVQSMLQDARLVQVLLTQVQQLSPAVPQSASDASSFSVCADVFCVTLIASSDAQLRLVLRQHPAVLGGLAKLLLSAPHDAPASMMLCATIRAAIQRVLSVMDHATLTTTATQSASSSSSAAAATPASGLAQLRSALQSLLPSQPQQMQPLLAFFA